MPNTRAPAAYPELQLGALAPAAPVAETLERIDALVARGERPLDRVADVIRRNRIVLIAADHLATADGGDQLARELEPFVQERIRRAAALDAATALLDRLGTELDIPVWGIKGLSSRIDYPRSTLRELRDADVCVGGADRAMALADRLRRHGYRTDHGELPWIKRTLDGAPYGQYKLTGPNGFAAVDIHFGPGYSTGHCGLLPLPEPTRPGLHPLPRVANLRPMLGNSGGDVHITVKDVNDLWVAARSLGPAEIDALAADARAVVLDGHLADIARVVLEITRTDAAQRTALERLIGAGPRRTAGPVVATGLMARTAPVRVLRTTGRAFGQAGAHTASLPSRVGAVLGALAFYALPTRPRVVAAPALSRRPAPWRCVRLVPLELARTLHQQGADAADRWPGDPLPPSADPAGPTGPGAPADTDDPADAAASAGTATSPPPVGEAAGADTPEGGLRWSAGHRTLTYGSSVFVSTVWGALPRAVVRDAGEAAR
ncbi:nucleotidyltransferase family protein [Streptomyces sp. XM4193]|uniref:nucleotidyltransferase family protein n=1 Tax=Streptomyces sp. XM4193 TaxID=2929782 RepID=UPI001FF85067|nr:nucleotidyltransferase family protein [Streptomyces sp. XM4193]MCK1798986.1 nucleotidyltransferase family protein [Streptomyces sp. XM4193]